jgi:hypothetical protein
MAAQEQSSLHPLCDPWAGSSKVLPLTLTCLVAAADKEVRQPTALLLDVEGGGTRTGGGGNKIYMQQSNHAQMFIPNSLSLSLSLSLSHTSILPSHVCDILYVSSSSHITPISHGITPFILYYHFLNSHSLFPTADRRECNVNLPRDCRL